MKILSLKLKSKKDANVFVASTDIGEYDLFSEIIVKYSLGVVEIDDEKFKRAVKESME